MSDKVWARKPNWIGTTVEDAFVMIDIDHGQYVSLNPTATDVWNAIETPDTVDRIVEKLVAHYDIGAEQCRKSVAGLLEKLEAMGLVSAS